MYINKNKCILKIIDIPVNYIIINLLYIQIV